jgi:hypothetical protein
MCFLPRQVPPVGSHAGFERRLEAACEGLSITPEQLRAELEAGGDLPGLVSGALTPQALRLTARTLALMRYPPESDPLPEHNGETTGG